MFEWLRKRFSPTVEEIMVKEDKQAEKLYKRIRKDLFAWAKNPIEYNVHTFVDSPLNRRIQERLDELLKENLLDKYNCRYHISYNGFAVVQTSWNTDELVLKDVKQC